MKKIKILIIGAGPTGLGAGYRLNELKEKNFLILEKNSYPGGLSFTLKDNKDFLWDFGGHVLFSHYKYFDQMYEKIMRNDYYSHLRESYVIYDKKTWIPYPFQYNIHHFKDKNIVFKIAYSVIKNKYSNIKPKNFKEWILKIFGEEISNIFMSPYNFKVWAIPLEKMDYQWIGERVAQINEEIILESAILSKDYISWGPNNKFKFPKMGGNNELWKRIAKIIENNILYNKQVVWIDFKKKIVKTKNDIFNYEYLINTMPVDLLINNSDAPKELKKISKNLKKSKVHMVGIGLKQPILKKLKNKCWFYFPTFDIPIYRATIFSTYSKYNVPDIKKYWSIMTETSESEYKKIPSELKKEIVDGLIKLGFIKNKKQVNHITTFSRDYAYPIPTLDRDKILERIHKFLIKYEVYSRGRFGGWKYEVGNMDHSFMQGVEVVEKILLNKNEITYFKPEEINSMKLKN